MNLISFTFLYDTDATVSEIRATSVGSILISSVYPAADATRTWTLSGDIFWRTPNERSEGFGVDRGVSHAQG